MCTQCDAASTLQRTRPYVDRFRPSGAAASVAEPWCDGICFHHFQHGPVVWTEAADVYPCATCTGAAGCTSCTAGSYRAPDGWAQFKYGTAAVPSKCDTCGWCQLDKCTGASGCTACDTHTDAQGVTQTAASLAVPSVGGDVQHCISDYCDTLGLLDWPANWRLRSSAPTCAENAQQEAQCNSGVGCTAW